MRLPGPEAGEIGDGAAWDASKMGSMPALRDDGGRHRGRGDVKRPEHFPQRIPPSEPSNARAYGAIDARRAFDFSKRYLFRAHAFPAKVGTLSSNCACTTMRACQAWVRKNLAFDARFR